MNAMLKIIVSIFFLSSILNLLPSASEASVPHLINYQGRLTDTSGTPLNGSYAVTFRIYDAETAGSMLWEEAHTGLVIQKGIFSVLLGSVTSMSLAFDKQYYLEIKVGTEVMSPRQRITSAGYAVRAEEAEKLGGKPSTDYALASDITSSPTANKAVKLDSNAKLPLTALKVYDSGWFGASAGSSYAKTHNLGTTKVLITVYFSTNSDGSSLCALAGHNFYYEPYGNEGVTYVTSLTTTTINVRGSPNYIAHVMNDAGIRTNYRSGYLRIIMLALE